MNKKEVSNGPGGIKTWTHILPSRGERLSAVDEVSWARGIAEHGRKVLWVFHRSAPDKLRVLAGETPRENNFSRRLEWYLRCYFERYPEAQECRQSGLALRVACAVPVPETLARLTFNTLSATHYLQRLTTKLGTYKVTIK